MNERRLTILREFLRDEVPIATMGNVYGVIMASTIMLGRVIVSGVFIIGDTPAPVIVAMITVGATILDH